MVSEQEEVAAYVLSLHKQEPLCEDDEPLPDMELHVSRPLPRDLPPEAMAELYKTDAQSLARRLWDILPGGTIDQLLIELMQRRASLLRVGFMSLDQVAKLAESEPVGRVVDVTHGHTDHGWPCCKVGKATTRRYVPQLHCGGPDTCDRCKEWRMVYHGGRVDYGPPPKAEPEWIESRHDWGDPGRCRFWAAGQRCRRYNGHDLDEFPHGG